MTLLFKSPSRFSSNHRQGLLLSRDVAGTFPAITGDRCRTGPGGDVEPLRARDVDRPSLLLQHDVQNTSVVFHDVQIGTPWGDCLRLCYFDRDSPPSG